MKVFLVTVAALLVVSMGVQAQSRSSGTTYEVTIQLTDSQVDLVSTSRSGEADVTLTDDQVKVVAEVVPEVAEGDTLTVTLEPVHLSRTGLVLIDVLVPEDMGPGDEIEMDPQPVP